MFGGICEFGVVTMPSTRAIGYDLILKIDAALFFSRTHRHRRRIRRCRRSRVVDRCVAARGFIPSRVRRVNSRAQLRKAFRQRLGLRSIEPRRQFRTHQFLQLGPGGHTGVALVVAVSRRGVNEILAGLQTVDAINAAIVSRATTRRLQRALAGLHHVAQRAHGCAWQRLSVLVENGAGDDAAARDLELHLQTLAVGQLNRRARPAGLLLTVRGGDVPGLGSREVESAFREGTEREGAAVVCDRAPAAADVSAARQTHARAARWLARPRDDHRAGDRPFADDERGAWRVRIARRILCRTRIGGRGRRALEGPKPHRAGRRGQNRGTTRGRQTLKGTLMSHMCLVRRPACECRLVDRRKPPILPE